MVKALLDGGVPESDVLYWENIEVDLIQKYNHAEIMWASSSNHVVISPPSTRHRLSRSDRDHPHFQGGHGGAADNKQRAYMWALSYNFLWQTLAEAAGAKGEDAAKSAKAG